MDKNERNYLVEFAKDHNFKTIFEFGTRWGLTADALARNADIVYTIDIDPEARDKCKEKNVFPIVGDSLIFDFSPYYNMMDMVFIDGSHLLKFVRSDSRNAVKMVKNGGFIFWHDYSLSHMYIVDFVNSFCRKNRFKFGDVAGTKLVFCIVKN